MADKKKNRYTLLGEGKVRWAHHGRDSMGLKMKMKDRAKLLKAGASDLVEGMKRDADKKAKIKRNK